MKYLKNKFSVPYLSKEYRENFDKIFKKEEKKEKNNQKEKVGEKK
jgi:hypothetical protein